MTNNYAERIEALMKALDDAEGKLASLADTVAAALRNSNLSDKGIGLGTDLREYVWNLSYETVQVRQERDRLRAEASALRTELARLKSLDDSAIRLALCHDMNDALRAELARVREALKEIAKGEGAFSLDPLTHATNVIDSMRAIAIAALNVHQNAVIHCTVDNAALAAGKGEGEGEKP